MKERLDGFGSGVVMGLGLGCFGLAAVVHLLGEQLNLMREQIEMLMANGQFPTQFMEETQIIVPLTNYNQIMFIFIIVGSITVAISAGYLIYHWGKAHQ